VWCGEIRLADFKMDNALSLSFERLGLRQNSVSAFRPEMNNAISEQFRNP
jgi:hypothetical protein